MIAGDVSAANFDRDLGRIAVQMGDEDRLDDLIEGAFLVDHRFQSGGEGADQAIGKEHAEEGTDQRTADHGAKYGRRLGDRTHGLDNAEHGGHDPEGREAIGQILQGMRWLERLVMVLFELFFHRIFDLVRVFKVHGHHTQRVADEIHGEMIFDDLWKPGKDRAVFGLFDMAFQSDHAFGLHGLGQQKQQGQ